MADAPENILNGDHTADGSRPRRERRINAAVYLGIFTLVLAAWLPALRSGLIWDDYFNVILAPERWTWLSLRDFFLPLDTDISYLRPLPRLSFQLDELVWGASRLWGWHLTNVVWHAMNAVLVAVVARPLGRFGAVTAAMVFGLHPLATETVSWISARPDLLVTDLMLVSILLLRRGHWRISALVLLGALLCKEIAVVFPLMLTLWLLYRREPWRQSRWHWLALVVFLAYRFAALRGLGNDPEWALDYLGLLWRPWVALGFPLPLSLPGWPSPGDLAAPLWWLAAVVCAAFLVLLVRRYRRIWPFVVLLLLAMLPIIPAFQLGPSFQFGRYLYWPLVFWGIMAGVALREFRYWKLGGLVCYGAILVLLTLPPGGQFAAASRAGPDFLARVKAVTPEVTPGTRLWVNRVPAQVNGWNPLGTRLELALNQAYGQRFDAAHPVTPVFDVGWQVARGGKVSLPKPDDVILVWDGHHLAVPDYQSWYLGAAPDAATESAFIDFGSWSLAQYRAYGFMWNDGDAVDTWNWTILPEASFDLPFSGESSALITLRVMSQEENLLQVAVNGISLGEAEVHRGYRWQTLEFQVPAGAWLPGPTQRLSLMTGTSSDGLYLAFDRLDMTLPAPPEMGVGFDFGTVWLPDYRAEGFRWNETGGDTTWNWLVAPQAVLDLPVPLKSHATLTLRVMSTVDNKFRVTLNGISLGEAALAGGHRWQTFEFAVPAGAWSPALAQHIVLAVDSQAAGLYLALDRLDIGVGAPQKVGIDLDFGTLRLTDYGARGFRWNEADGDTTWNWLLSPRAGLDAPVPGMSGGTLSLRVMSAADNQLRVAVNGVSLGEVAVAGGHRWQWLEFAVPAGAWTEAPAQRIDFEVASQSDGVYLAIDRLRVRPVLP